MIRLYFCINIVEKDQNNGTNITPVVLIGKNIGKRIVGKGLVPHQIHLPKDLIENSGTDIILRRSEPGDDLPPCRHPWSNLFKLFFRNFCTFVIAANHAACEQEGQRKCSNDSKRKSEKSLYGFTSYGRKNAWTTIAYRSKWCQDGLKIRWTGQGRSSKNNTPIEEMTNPTRRK